MRGLIFDPFAGISGDMVLGALLDLGVPEDWFHDFVASLDLGSVEVITDRVQRAGIACGRIRFELPEEHVHRHLPDVLGIVEDSGAPPPVRERAVRVFRRLAEAEAGIHGIEVDRVHFHEVGALDSILDVLCAVGAVYELGVDRCFTRPVTIGTGTVEIEHGTYPVPAPATLALLAEMAVRATRYDGECTTPTGAALLAALTNGQREPERTRVLRSGYGAGTRNPEDRPNCLRLILCELDAAETGPESVDRLYLVQADMDDLPGEYLPPARDALFEAGARDVVVSSVAMKKGRPGLRIEVLVDEERLDATLSALFDETTTIGARYWPVQRPALGREHETVRWRDQRIRLKRVTLPDGRTRAKPEFEDVARAARATGIPAADVRAALERGEGTPADAAG